MEEYDLLYKNDKTIHGIYNISLAESVVSAVKSRFEYRFIAGEATRRSN